MTPQPDDEHTAPNGPHALTREDHLRLAGKHPEADQDREAGE